VFSVKRKGGKDNSKKHFGRKERKPKGEREGGGDNVFSITTQEGGKFY